MTDTTINEISATPGMCKPEGIYENSGLWTVHR